MFKSGSGFPSRCRAAIAGCLALAALFGCELPAKPPPEPTGPIPWTAAIGRLDAEGDSTSCTATLVEPDVIVTAAHCLFPTKRKLSPSELTSTPNVGAQRLPTVRVVEIIGVGADKMDPDNPQDTPTEVDWAILRLASPVPNVTPIPVEPVALADVERRIKAGEDVLSNLGYGTYGITISRRFCALSVSRMGPPLSPLMTGQVVTTRRSSVPSVISRQSSIRAQPSLRCSRRLMVMP